MNPADWKVSTAPPRHGWAPGEYLNNCHTCGCVFIGDKRAWTCADCAYKEPDPPTTEERIADLIRVTSDCFKTPNST